MEGENVYVVVDEYANRFPYIAYNIEAALSQHSDRSNGETVVGVFIYGNDFVACTDN
ncbi:hypothetical protein SEA_CHARGERPOWER_76 [Mycobacterium phage Chargerpower]|nr:hypothetical protein SEA_CHARGERPOWER_76 [Mycobacterium phage Chargerpower]